MITSQELHRRADMLAAQERGEGVLECHTDAPAYIGWVPHDQRKHDIGREDRQYRLAPLPPKPCPFCGAIPKPADNPLVYWVAHLEDCWITTYRYVSEIERWNRRAQP